MVAIDTETRGGLQAEDCTPKRLPGYGTRRGRHPSISGPLPRRPWAQLLADSRVTKVFSQSMRALFTTWASSESFGFRATEVRYAKVATKDPVAPPGSGTL